MADDVTLTEDDLLADPGPTSWAPPEGVVRHAGGPLEPGTDLFAPPPPEIGDVISADSTLRVGKRPKNGVTRLVIGGLVGWGVAMLISLAGGELIWQALAFVGVLVLAWLATRFGHTCSYVGNAGVARFRCSGRRDRLKPAEVFLFEDAAELRTGQTRHYHNGVYTHTAYSFQWTDARGAKVFKLSGSYRGEKKPPKPVDAFHFAEMAESAWSAFLFEHAQRELAEHGSIRFGLGGSDFVLVGPGFLELGLKGRRERLAVEEIGSVAIDAGVFKVKRTDAVEGWFSKSGVFQFSYEQMANARLFLLAYSRLVAA